MRQAPSLKLQAPSSKLQAPKKIKIDMKDNVGYCISWSVRNRFKRLSSLTLIPGRIVMHHRGNVVKHWHNLCSATWDRNIDRAMRSGMEPVVNSTVKILGNGWNPRLQAKPFYFSLKPKAPSIKLQASSPKHKGSSFKPQASSSKILEPGYK